jgi:predicted nucleic acid-binding Zn ribbon protein
MAQVLGRLGASTSPQLMELVFTRWVEVVGPQCADHLHPMRLQGDTLVVGVDHPAWATRARLESEHILARLQELGGSSIVRIEVVVERP